MQDFDFLKPKTLSELCVTLAETGGNILAGGTEMVEAVHLAAMELSYG